MDILIWLTSKFVMIIFMTMNITSDISIVVINYIFGFGNDFFAVHTIFILYPIVYLHISVTYSYTYMFCVYCHCKKKNMC